MSLPKAALKGLAAVGVWMAVTASAPVFAASPQETSSQPETGAPATSKPSFDPVVATDAYLAKLTPEQRARSDAYFEGGYRLQYLLVTTVLSFPLTVYSGFIREHKYRLATQSFGPWPGDQAKGLLVGASWAGWR
jgi:STE24 endopeptidase